MSMPPVYDVAASSLPEPAWETEAGRLAASRPPLSPSLCHRCDGDLPFRVGAGESGSLFCPHCGAPQLLLPAHLLPDPEASQRATTGVIAPPRPGLVAWPDALLAAVPAALAGGLLLGVSTAVPSLSLVVAFFVLFAPVAVVTAYRRRVRSAGLGARGGFRIGLVTGLLMLLAMGLALGTAGLIARFGLHRMAGFDGDLSASLHAAQAQSDAMLAGSDQAPEVSARMKAFMGSPEGRAGMALFTLLFQSCLILLFSALGGVLAGMAGARARQTRAL